jgi:hypothetical protein
VNGFAGGTNTLQAGNSSSNTWDITAANAGEVAGVTFTNFADLEAGSGGDTFNIDALIGNLTGGIGEDEFNIEATTASINAGANDDTINIASMSLVTGELDGEGGDRDTLNFTADEQTLNLADISGIEFVNGLGGVNTLEGADRENTWEVTSVNGGEINDTINFTHFANLTGGSSIDRFELENITDITGLIDGSGGVDYLTITGSEQTIELGVDVTLVENLIANVGDAELIATNNYNIWAIDGKNSGNVKENTETVNFNGFSSISGGSDVDEFTISGSGNITELIDGGTGSDTLDITANDVSVVELGSDISDNLNVNNIEEITANSANTNTLIADDVGNIWTIDGDESGSLTYSGITTLFNNFANLVGGSDVDKFTVNGGGVTTISMGQNDDSISLLGGYVSEVFGNDGDDSFTVSGGTAGTMLGNKGIDTIVYTLDNVSVTVGDDIGSFEGVSAQQGNGIINAKDGVRTTWEIDAENAGSVSDSSSADELFFSGFSTVNGGTGVDEFILKENGSITDIINGGGSDDTLTVNLDSELRTESGVITFNGGDGDDDVIISGTADSYSEVYSANVEIDDIQFDQFAFVNNDSNVYVGINLRVVEEVQDTIETTSLTINDGQNDDVLTISLTEFGVESALVNVTFDSLNKGDITVAAEDSSLTFTDSLLVDGDLSISANEVNQTTGLVTADSLILSKVGDMGIEDAIEVAISELSISDHSGDINLNQSGDLSFTELSNSTGAVNITVNSGDINATNALSSSGDLTLNATEISLIGNNQLTGGLDLSADDIKLNNDAITRLVGLKTNNVSVTSTDSIIADGDLLLANNGSGIATLVSSQGDVQLNGTTAADLLSVSANNDVLINNLSAQSLNIDSRTGSIVGNGVTSISAGSDDVTTSLTANAGDITFSNASNDFGKISVSANNATITDVNDLTIVDSTLSNNLTINANGKVQVGEIIAGDSIYLDAGEGNIVSNDSHLIAPEITLRATTGIGVGDYDTLVNNGSYDSSNAINIETALLSAINSDSGALFIENNQAVSITDLRNQGDIIFNNVGDITLQTTENSSGETQGAIDANYGLSTSNEVYSGSVAILNDGVSSLYTTGFGFNEPDIIAENLLVNSVTSFGTTTLPIRIRVNTDFTLIASLGSVYYYGGAPETVTTSNDIILDIVDTLTGLTSQQLVEVESLTELDPAIFSDVRNYTVDDNSVYLPEDQRLDEDEDDDEEQGI